MPPTRFVQCLAIVLIATSGVAARAAELEQCQNLAQSMDEHYFGFPSIEADTITPLAAWRASCASEPPSGLGQVFALCEARLSSEGHVFFWYKTGIEAETSGYEICDF